jgi:phosphatidylinositol alpha-1,6-mannosyltransferase
MDDKLFTPSTDRSGLRKSLGWNVDDFVLVTAGNLIGKKNFDTVIRALAKLIDEGHGNMRYVAVGDGPDEEGLKRLTKQLKIADRVEFVGRKTQSALARYYQAADLYVQVSRNHLLESGGVDVETMGRTYFEAGGCGIPVIGARVGGVPSVIEDGKNGLLVEDPEDEEELVGKIEQVLSDSALRTNMADEGIKRATESLSWNAVGAKFEQILRSVRR